jgi:hypothetical protein
MTEMYFRLEIKASAIQHKIVQWILGGSEDMISLENFENLDSMETF